jgi:hypothetical protein
MWLKTPVSNKNNFNPITTHPFVLLTLIVVLPKLRRVTLSPSAVLSRAPSWPSHRFLWVVRAPWLGCGHRRWKCSMPPSEGHVCVRVFLVALRVLQIPCKNTHHVRLSLFLAMKWCFSLTTFQHKHQHKPNSNTREQGDCSASPSPHCL